MPWHELQLLDLPREALDVVSDRLFGLGAAGLQEDWMPGEAPPPRQPWDTGPAPPVPDRLLLRAWFEDPDREQVLARLGAVPAATRWEQVEEQDWAEGWRAGFTPVHVSARLVISPPWCAPPGALLVEPGQGFGTGQHPTTVQALRGVDALADGCRTALDVGSGSGVLALAAAKLGLEARGVDVEASAVRDALANAERNGLPVPFDTTPVGRLRQPADLVLANLHAELITQLADDLVRLTGRWLVLAGILADREGLVREALDARLVLRHRERDGEWVSLRYEAAR